jgi:hypothetical protein
LKECGGHAPELLQDGLGGFDPDEGFSRSVVLLDETSDFTFKLEDRCEDAALQALTGYGGGEAFDGVQPGGRGGRDAEGMAKRSATNWKTRRG